MVHRAMQGYRNRCMNILMGAPPADPLSQWIGDDADKRRAYNRYILCRGFQGGSVVVGQRGSGICIATHSCRDWGLRLIWARLRLWSALSADGHVLGTV